MQAMPQKGTSEDSVNNREERFCLAFVKTGKRYEAFDTAGYEASTQDSKAAAVSRLLKRPHIKARIDVIQREYFAAIGIDKERILGNLAGIAFGKEVQRSDRIRALELLGKACEGGIWTDNIGGRDTDQKPLTAAQQARYEVLARKENIRLSKEKEA